MIDEATFRRESDLALEALKQSLIAAEDDSGAFEFEDNNGVMNIIFENGSSKFVVTPNTPVRQIWISAQATSFKLEWTPKPPATFNLTRRPAKTSKPSPSASSASTSRPHHHPPLSRSAASFRLRNPHPILTSMNNTSPPLLLADAICTNLCKLSH